MMTRKTVAAAVLCVLAGAASVQLAAQAPAAKGGAVPTFTKDVAPILYKNCTNCHRPGEIAPMSLLTYKDARPWAKSIATQVGKSTMPPWHADPAFGDFVNDRRLSDAERTRSSRGPAAARRKAIRRICPRRPSTPTSG